MKNTIVSAAMLLSFSAISVNANAAEIQFSGAITASTCYLEGNDGDLVMKLPTFGINDVTEVGQHNGVINLSAKAVCAEGTDGLVTMAMKPNPNSFEGKVLKNTHTGQAKAAGVGIVVMGDDRQPMDFSQGDAAKITAPMTGGVANIMVSATYAKDGSGDDVTAGEVAAVLPFVMTYM